MNGLQTQIETGMKQLSASDAAELDRIIERTERSLALLRIKRRSMMGEPSISTPVIPPLLPNRLPPITSPAVSPLLNDTGRFITSEEIDALRIDPMDFDQAAEADRFDEHFYGHS